MCSVVVCTLELHCPKSFISFAFTIGYSVLGVIKVCLLSAVLQVEHYPYDPDFMLFMDYRDYKCRDAGSVGSEETPTFLYAMPISPNRVFFEVRSAFLLDGTRAAMSA